MAELYDIVIRRQVYIEGLKRAKASELNAVVLAFTNEVRNRLALLDYRSLGDMTRTAIRLLVIDLQKIAQRVFNPWLSSLLDWLREFMNVDRNMLVSLYGDFVEPSKVEKAKDGDKLFAAAWRAPMAATGTLPAAFLAGLLPLAMVKLDRLTTAAYANRASPGDLVRTIAGSAASRYQDGALASVARAGVAATNTVVQHLSSQGNDAIAALLFSWYEWISILDNHTTLICISRAGHVYQFGKGPVPPAHVGCRSTTAPIPSKDARLAPTSFGLWVRGQSTDFLNDAFDGSISSRYEGSKPITLAQYAGKRTLIGA